MSNKLKATISTTINTSADRLWEALTNPSQIKQYLFGTDTATDWKVGSPIIFRGIYNNKSYEDKGVIRAFDPGKRLSYTYWSSMSGKEDVPDNYATVTFELNPKDEATELMLIQDNIDNETSREHSEENWKMVLKNLKELLEGKLGIELN